MDGRAATNGPTSHASEVFHAKEEVVIQLDLTEHERLELKEVLESSLSDLRMEIAKTDRQAFRDQLKIRKGVLVKVIESLGAQML